MRLGFGFSFCSQRFYQFAFCFFRGIVGNFFQHLYFLSGCNIQIVLFFLKNFQFFVVIVDLLFKIFFQFSGFTKLIIQLALFVFDAFLRLLHFLFSRLDVCIVLGFQFKESFFSLKLLFFFYGFCLYISFFYNVFGALFGVFYHIFCLRIDRAFPEEKSSYGSYQKCDNTDNNGNCVHKFIYIEF